MHELAVTQGILDIVMDAARRNGGARIYAIDLVIGDMSSIVDDSIQFYFDILGKGTPAEGATLRFRRRPATAVCLDCNHQVEIRARLADACPHCGSVRMRVSGGRDFYVESIEVKEARQDAAAAASTDASAQSGSEPPVTAMDTSTMGQGQQ